MRFDHVSAGTVRFWAMIDTSVIALALPVTAKAFLGLIYDLNGVLGFADTAPDFAPMHMFFVNLSGVLVAVWAAARLLNPIGLMAFIDAIGRTAVALLIIWFTCTQEAPPAMWFFVLTEGLGAVAQMRACLRRPN